MNRGAATVAVIGLGRVGAANDFVPGTVPRSHVGAVLATSGLRISALVDRDLGCVAETRRRWPELETGVAASDISELTPGCADVIAICAPPESRIELIGRAAALGPRLLIVEKPLAMSLGEAKRGVAAAAGIPIRVNFQRRLDPGHRRARVVFSGRPAAVTMRYGKGLANYGSHLIDLLLDWCGPIVAVAATERVPAGADPTVGFRCRFADGLEASVTGLGNAAYDSFDADFFFREGRLELAAGGVERRVWRPVRDRYYPGYSHLAVDDSSSETSPVGGLAELYAAALDHIRSGAALGGCDVPAALAGLAVIEAVRRSAANDASWQQVIAA